jgi:two-component system, OmpR family, alkaline phosphatase synthesis response regulator PhoP
MKAMKSQPKSYSPVIKGGTGKILVIENDRGAARLAEYTLCMAGYEVLIAYNGTEGISKALSEQPDLIILDVVTPVIDGHEICGHLWDRYESDAIPILVVTSKTPEQGCSIRKRIGIDNYLVKPVEPMEMLDKVASLLNISDNKSSAAKQIANGKKNRVLRTTHV